MGVHIRSSADAADFKSFSNSTGCENFEEQQPCRN